MLSNKDKRFFAIFVGLLLLFAVIGLIITYPEKKSEPEVSSSKETSKSVESGKLQVCPDAWYSDQMPQVNTEKGSNNFDRQYFVIDGKRKEMANYDLEWIRTNCLVKGPVNVY